MGDGQGMSTTKKVLIGVGIAAAGVLAYSVLSEEPPIRVKGGSLDVEIRASNTAKWEPAGNEWNLKSGGTNISGNYNFTIVVGNHCSPPPTSVKEVNIAMAQEDIQIKSHFFKTKMKTKGYFQQVSDRLLTYSGSDTLTVTVKPGTGNNNQWQCTFPKDEFQELCLYKGTPCP
jgi:Pyruvate/2-oxoacid:ferredoxin oxidoreductase gamma subunit